MMKGTSITLSLRITRSLVCFDKNTDSTGRKIVLEEKLLFFNIHMELRWDAGRGLWKYGREAQKKDLWV